MMRRMEDKIRSLCRQILAKKDDDELMRSMLIELQEALHQHVERIRARLNQYPIVSERREPNHAARIDMLPRKPD
jgi:hypothetical protein